jgi:hypothetical protein
MSAASQDAARARATLAKLQPMALGDVADLEKMAKDEDNAAKREAGHGGCQKKCESHKTAAKGLRTNLSLAKDRDAANAFLAQATATLNKAQAVQQTGNVESSGLAVIVKTYLGVPAKFTDSLAAFVRVVLALVLLKVLTYMTIPGMALWMKANQVVEEKVEAPVVDVEALIAETEARVRAEMTIEEPKSPIEQILAQVDDENIAAWGDAIAAILIRDPGLFEDNMPLYVGEAYDMAEDSDPKPSKSAPKSKKVEELKIEEPASKIVAFVARNTKAEPIAKPAAKAKGKARAKKAKVGALGRMGLSRTARVEAGLKAVAGV